MQPFKHLFLLLIFVCAACGGDSSDDDGKAGTSAGKGGKAGNGGSSSGESGSSGTGGGDASASDAGDVDGAVNSKDGGGKDTTGGDKDDTTKNNDGDDDTSDDEDAGTDDAGMTLHGMGSCCAEHETPGCANADLQVCVCEAIPDCCTTAWNARCVAWVEEKHCQDTSAVPDKSVRECVCETWEQASCCTTWTDFCDAVAEEENKCNADPGCF